MLQDDQYVIGPILPELRSEPPAQRILDREYSSADDLMSFEGVADLLRRRRLMIEDTLELEGEFLR